MPRKTPSPPVFDKARDRWRVSLPASLSPSGLRVRSWHLTREAARDYLSAVTNTLNPAAVIPPALAMKADEARLILEPWGLDLVDGAKTLASVLEALGGAGSPLEAAKLYAAQHAERTASKPFGEAVGLFLRTRDGLREDTLRGYRHHLNNSFAGLRERMLSDITPAEIDALLAERPPSSKRAAQIILGVLWRWAASPPRIWCKVDVIDALEPVRISRETEIVCLSPEAAAALLRAAENTSPGCAVGFAVAIFGGVRLRELGKLTWKNIGETHIEVGADIAKRHARRLIPICPTLKAWLGTYRRDLEGRIGFTIRRA
jgi:hypothetical protein